MVRQLLSYGCIRRLTKGATRRAPPPLPADSPLWTRPVTPQQPHHATAGRSTPRESTWGRDGHQNLHLGCGFRWCWQVCFLHLSSLLLTFTALHWSKENGALVCSTGRVLFFSISPQSSGLTPALQWALKPHCHRQCAGFSWRSFLEFIQKWTGGLAACGLVGHLLLCVAFLHWIPFASLHSMIPEKTRGRGFLLLLASVSFCFWRIITSLPSLFFASSSLLVACRIDSCNQCHTASIPLVYFFLKVF
ncbi:hypothetical protein IWX90DRAFT_11023 [Phyllosticta citrichinensis]|uniref:Uncharacterized protein n=1 Tax=Phyllosticta citrichinensis TaxID=1130410 RepID=A0ABR1Y5X7_9PEZI